MKTSLNRAELKAIIIYPKVIVENKKALTNLPFPKISEKATKEKMLWHCVDLQNGDLNFITDVAKIGGVENVLSV